MRWRPASTSLASATMLGIAALHAGWGLGSSWPLANREALADAVVGRDDVPPPAACFAVTGALVVAAGLVGARPQKRPLVRRIGAAGVVATLTARGALGLVGRTDALSAGSTSRTFRDLDRRVYSPLCLVLAALALPATTS